MCKQTALKCLRTHSMRPRARRAGSPPASPPPSPPPVGQARGRGGPRKGGWDWILKTAAQRPRSPLTRAGLEERGLRSEAVSGKTRGERDPHPDGTRPRPAPARPELLLDTRHAGGPSPAQCPRGPGPPAPRFQELPESGGGGFHPSSREGAAPQLTEVCGLAHAAWGGYPRRAAGGVGPATANCPLKSAGICSTVEKVN